MARSQKKAKRPGRRPRPANSTMTRRELAQKVYKHFDRRYTADEIFEIMQAMLDYMAEAMGEGCHIEFRDFGVFEVVERKARVGRNPRNPDETYEIPARKVVKFKMARKLMDQLQENN